MRTFLKAAAVAAMIAIPVAGFAQATQKKSATHETHSSAKVATHTTAGVVKSSTDSSLVITKGGKDETFVVNSTTAEAGHARRRHARVDPLHHGRQVDGRDSDHGAAGQGRQDAEGQEVRSARGTRSKGPPPHLRPGSRYFPSVSSAARTPVASAAARPVP